MLLLLLSLTEHFEQTAALVALVVDAHIRGVLVAALVLVDVARSAKRRLVAVAVAYAACVGAGVLVAQPFDAQIGALHQLVLATFVRIRMI